MTVWRCLPRYDPERPFRVWLFESCQPERATADWRLKIRRSTIASLRTNEDIAPGFEPSPETTLLKAQAVARIEAAIDSLSPRYKQALALTLVDGLSQTEGAKVSGVDRKTIENQAGRAKARLPGLLKASDLRSDRLEPSAPVRAYVPVLRITREPRFPPTSAMFFLETALRGT